MEFESGIVPFSNSNSGLQLLPCASFTTAIAAAEDNAGEHRDAKRTYLSSYSGASVIDEPVELGHFPCYVPTHQIHPLL